jgi:predicted rRNA methylase YqxC with S4 and FtsJ domains
VCSLTDFSHLALAEPSLLILKEELDVWHRAYLPIGRTVLDLGAGCGETAQFYLNHGAERVICVESNPSFLTLLRQNFGNDPRITIIDANIDSIKCDIEGSEKNMIIETHFPAYLERQYAFKHQATVNIWKLKEMRNVLLMIRSTNKLLSRVHYARIQIAHAVREALSLT